MIPSVRRRGPRSQLIFRRKKDFVFFEMKGGNATTCWTSWKLVTNPYHEHVAEGAD
jgi:hypothetical protein